jgi:hypothetical protein
MSMLEPVDEAHAHAIVIPDASGVVPTSTEARAKRRIAALEEEIQTMRQEKGTKQRFVAYHFTHCLLLIDYQRKTTYYVAQGRAVRRMCVLYTNVEDLIAENDRRYEEAIVDDSLNDSTPE